MEDVHIDIEIRTYLLDDDKDLLYMVSLELNKIPDCHYSLHSNITDFLEAIEQGCHIGIIDYRLGERFDGIDVGKQVLKKNPNCFLIMLSGHDSKEVVIRSMNSGFRYYIDKGKPDYIISIGEAVKKNMPRIRRRIAFYEKYKNYA